MCSNIKAERFGPECRRVFLTTKGQSMPSYNKVILLGNLTRDPELRHLPSNMPVVQIGLAVNERYKDKNTGEYVERADFVDCEAFGKTAEMVNAYFSKGVPILIEGKLRQDQWEDRDTGRKRSKLKVIIDRVEFVLSKKDKRDAGYESGGSQSSEQQQPKPEPTNDDDIPF